MHLKDRTGHKVGPAVWMQELLAMHPQYRSIRIAVETGTFRGDGVLWFAKYFDTWHTVEIVPEMQALAKRRCEKVPNVVWHLGDSAKVVPELAKSIQEPVFWFLDAHYCPWLKAKELGEPHPVKGHWPLWDELRAIGPRPFSDIVLVDDAPLYGVAKPDYRAPGDTSPQWESLSDVAVIDTLRGRVCDVREYRLSKVYWRTAI